MGEIKTSRNGIDYILGILRDSPKRLTEACFWKIPHNDPEKEDIRLKITKYKKTRLEGIDMDIKVKENELSDITLTSEEFNNLVDFISANFQPLKDGTKQYIPLDQPFNPSDIEHLKGIFNNPNIDVLVSFLKTNDIFSMDLLKALKYVERQDAMHEFETNLEENLMEYDWQQWFETNKWVLGTDYVEVMDDRRINVENIADYLVKAYDGFLDIVEIKRPSTDMTFWDSTQDHGNYFPSRQLTKAITQAVNYIHVVEQQANSIEFLKRMDNVATVKPRCTLIFGRSNDWYEDMKAAYRLLNSSYHNLTILTYDHVLERARRVFKVFE